MMHTPRTWELALGPAFPARYRCFTMSCAAPVPPPLLTRSALKAIALERLGKAEEALTVTREVATATPATTDETVLSTLMIAFKALGRAEEGTACYEAAFAAEPRNSELAGMLFSSYMKTAEFAKDCE